MRRCARCHAWKPDANFLPPPRRQCSKEHTKVLGMCLHCRTVPEQVPGWTKRPEAQVRQIDATPQDLALKELARAEREAFMRRGAPRLDRPYVHTATGTLVGKSRPRSLRRGFLAALTSS